MDSGFAFSIIVAAAAAAATAAAHCCGVGSGGGARSVPDWNCSEVGYVRVGTGGAAAVPTARQVMHASIHIGTPSYAKREFSGL